MEELKEMLQRAGFGDIIITEKEKSNEIIKGWNFGEGVEHMVFSAYIPGKETMIITAAITKKKHVILRLDRSIQFLLDSPVKPGNDDFKVFNCRSKNKSNQQ